MNLGRCTLFLLMLSLVLLSTISAQNRTTGKRILIYHDMEGLSGEDDARQFSFRHKEQYAKGRELLTADINAVVAGLFDGGATLVNVVDAHGSGNPDPDVLLDKLDTRAQMVFRDKPFRQYVDIVEPNVYDAVVCVGMHAKTGSGGFASHTFTLGMDIMMNNQSITETELVGYSWGLVDVPIILVSGDDRLANDLKTMPWIEYVTVKKATSASTAELRPVEAVHKELRAAAKTAVGKIGKASVMKLPVPFTAALRVVPPASLAVLKDVPGIRYEENKVSFTANSFKEAYDGVIALIGVATRAYPQLLTETVRRLPNGEQILGDYSDKLTDRWLDYESGRWKPTPPDTTNRTVRRYHGAR